MLVALFFKYPEADFSHSWRVGSLKEKEKMVRGKISFNVNF